MTGIMDGWNNGWNDGRMDGQTRQTCTKTNQQTESGIEILPISLRIYIYILAVVPCASLAILLCLSFPTFLRCPSKGVLGILTLTQI